MRVRWTFKRYDEHLPHLDKFMLTGRTADGRVATKGGWFWRDHHERRYVFAFIRMHLNRQAEKAA